MAICWERAVPLSFHFSAVLVVRVPFPFGVWDRMWNSIVSDPEIAFLSTLLNNSKMMKGLRDKRKGISKGLKSRIRKR